MGDSCEMLVAAEMTLAGMPAMKVPDNWPHYDVVAQPPDGGNAQRISVKGRTFKRGASFVSYNANDKFDWLAIVLLPGGELPQRPFFIIPREVADRLARKDKETSRTRHQRYWRLDEVADNLARYANNFCLSRD